MTLVAGPQWLNGLVTWLIHERLRVQPWARPNGWHRHYRNMVCCIGLSVALTIETPLGISCKEQDIVSHSKVSILAQYHHKYV